MALTAQSLSCQLLGSGRKKGLKTGRNWSRTQHSLPALKQVGWGVTCDAQNSASSLRKGGSFSLFCLSWGEFFHLYCALTTSSINCLITEILELNQLPILMKCFFKLSSLDVTRWSLEWTGDKETPQVEENSVILICLLANHLSGLLSRQSDVPLVISVCEIWRGHRKAE